MDIQKSEGKIIRVEMTSWKDKNGTIREGLSIREFFNTEKYQGPGRSGIFIPKECVEEVKKAILAL